jgi:peptidoglycan/xylan/chitin deacetylase (PgdA/CDA1 family)
MSSPKSRVMSTPKRFQLSSFSRELYLRFLEQAQRAGFNFLRFCELDQADRSRCIVMRHDVDLSPEHALAMAEIEQEHGIGATYFVMVDGTFYNALDPVHMRAIRRMHGLGHEIGLHYSTRTAIKDDREQDVEHKIRVLEAIIEAPVRSFSQHDPVNAGALEPCAGRYIDAYRAIPRYGLLYVSDSGMMWRQHTFESALAENRSLCLLAHPISWLHESHDLIEIIRDAQRREAERAARRFDSFAENHIDYYERRRSEGV